VRVKGFWDFHNFFCRSNTKLFYFILFYFILFYFILFFFFFFFQSQISCGDIASDAQCTGDSAVMESKCGLYGNVCKLKCEEITRDDYTCNNTRSSDCFLIMGNPNTCVNKV
jgi:hypothetical protein